MEEYMSSLEFILGLSALIGIFVTGGKILQRLDTGNEVMKDLKDICAEHKDHLARHDTEIELLKATKADRNNTHVQFNAINEA